MHGQIRVVWRSAQLEQQQHSSAAEKLPDGLIVARARNSTITNAQFICQLLSPQPPLPAQHPQPECSDCKLSKRLTLSISVMPNGYASKRSAPYWSNPPFLVFLTFWHSGAQYALVDSFLPQLEKCGNERVN